MAKRKKKVRDEVVVNYVRKPVGLSHMDRGLEGVRRKVTAVSIGRKTVIFKGSPRQLARAVVSRSTPPRRRKATTTVNRAAFCASLHERRRRDYFAFANSPRGKGVGKRFKRSGGRGTRFTAKC